MPPVLILRPADGAARSIAALSALGVVAQALPLFALHPLAWVPPAADDFDGLLITSAAALSLGGAALGQYARLPAHIVGPVSADAARAAGLTLGMVGDSDGNALLRAVAAAWQGDAPCRILWPCAREHSQLEVPGNIMLQPAIVYAAEESPVDATRLHGPAILLVHSARAAMRLAALSPYKSALTLIAISPNVAAAAGPGWAAVHVAPRPRDADMVALAAELCKKRSEQA